MPSEQREPLPPPPAQMPGAWTVLLTSIFNEAREIMLLARMPAAAHCAYWPALAAFCLCGMTAELGPSQKPP